MAVIFYFPLSSKVSWSSHLLCISQFQVCPCTPGQVSGINCTNCQSWGWGISKLCTVQRSGICQPLGHPLAFGTHMHSFWNITKHGGFYEKHQQICRLTHLSRFMPAFLHCLIKPEVRSYCPELTFFLSWNEISVDLGFDYNLAVMIFVILLSLIYLLYLLFRNIWLGTDISKVQKSEYDEVVSSLRKS